MWFAFVRELIMIAIIAMLLGTAIYIAYCCGKRNGINEERMYLIDMLGGIPMTSFAEEVRYGASVAIGHISNKLREE